MNNNFLRYMLDNDEDKTISKKGIINDKTNKVIDYIEKSEE